MKRSDLVAYLDSYLHINEITDYGPQGLQVEAAGNSIERVALAVDSAPAVIEAAAGWQADMLLVHHGILWGAVEPIAGPLGQRVRLLLQHDINLYAAHLALDAHPEVGNNTVLAQRLGLEVEEWWCEPTNAPIGVLGSLPGGLSLEQLVERVEGLLDVEARVLPQGPPTVQRLAIVSGSAAEQAGTARALGADTFLTGETSHAHYWAAADYGLNLIYAGHYATETVGVQALGRHLAEAFGIEVKFLDFPTDM